MYLTTRPHRHIHPRSALLNALIGNILMLDFFLILQIGA